MCNYFALLHSLIVLFRVYVCDFMFSYVYYIISSLILGRFPFDQKFRKFRVWKRMEQTFSGISFRNFGCTSRGWPKIPENRNNRKIPFHSTIPARAQFLRANRTQHGCQFICSISEFRLAGRPDPFPSGIFPVGMTARVNSSQVSLVILK